eukprot:10312412-Ditylum_brightwellii.AAC.1
MQDFGHDVRKFNTWFVNQHNKTVREVGKKGYMEYLCSLFCIYKTTKDEVFLNEIKDKETKWVIGNLPEQYKYKDLIDFTLKLYSNRKAASEWKGSAKDQKKPTNNDAKFLAMMTNLEQLKKAMEMTSINLTPKTKNGEAEKGPRFQPWQYENKEGKETLQRNNRTYCWCTKDFHPKPMWCTCTNCLNKADFATKMDKEREGR